MVARLCAWQKYRNYRSLNSKHKQERGRDFESLSWHRGIFFDTKVFLKSVTIKQTLRECNTFHNKAASFFPVSTFFLFLLVSASELCLVHISIRGPPPLFHISFPKCAFYNRPIFSCKCWNISLCTHACERVCGRWKKRVLILNQWMKVHSGVAFGTQGKNINLVTATFLPKYFN